LPESWRKGFCFSPGTATATAGPFARCLLKPRASPSLRAALGVKPPSLPPSPSLRRGSQSSTYPSECRSEQPQDGPPSAPRPSGRESRSPARVWLRVGARRESRLLTPRARCAGSRKQLNFTTARSVTASWRRGG